MIGDNKAKLFITLSYVVALVSMLGSLYMSEVKHFIPCMLCWVQRGFMYPQVLILLLALFVKEGLQKSLLKISLVLSMIGSIVSIYHIVVQNTSVESVCNIGVSCDYKYINLLGFITIPVMCLIAFVLIIIGVSIVLKDKKVKGVKTEYGKG